MWPLSKLFISDIVVGNQSQTIYKQTGVVVTIKLYLQEEKADRIWPTDLYPRVHSLTSEENDFIISLLSSNV